MAFLDIETDVVSVYVKVAQALKISATNEVRQASGLDTDQYLLMGPGNTADYSR